MEILAYCPSYYGSRDSLFDSSHKCGCLLRKPCECQAELGDIAKIAKESFVFSFRLVMYLAAIVGSV